MTPHLKVCGQGQAAKKGHIYFQGRVARDVVLGQAGCPSAIILCFSAAKIGN